MVEITKAEAKELNERGVPFKENGISKSIHNRHYYLCESRKNISILKTIRESKKK